jgi:uncharacterized protein (DUF2384 family)
MSLSQPVPRSGFVHWDFRMGDNCFVCEEKPVILRDQVLAHALETFGQEAKALHWLNRPNHLFGGLTPAEVLESEPQSVEQKLILIDHGIFV